MSTGGGAAGSRSPLPGVGFALAAIVTLQAGNAIGVRLMDVVDVPGAVALRLAFAAALLMVVLRPPVAMVRDEPLLVAAFGLAIAVLAGATYGAIRHLPIAVATTIALLGPLTVAAAGSRQRRELMWPACALVGVGLMGVTNGGGEHRVSVVGVGFAALAAAAWATYIVLSAAAGARFHGVQALAVAVLVAACVWMSIALAVDGPAPLLHRSVLLLALGAGAVTTAGPYVLESVALRRLPRHVFATLASLEPAAAALVGLVLLDQGLSAGIVAGMALVVVASAGAARAEVSPRRG